MKKERFFGSLVFFSLYCGAFSMREIVKFSIRWNGVERIFGIRLTFSFLDYDPYHT